MIENTQDETKQTVDLICHICGYTQTVDLERYLLSLQGHPLTCGNPENHETPLGHTTLMPQILFNSLNLKLQWGPLKGVSAQSKTIEILTPLFRKWEKEESLAKDCGNYKPLSQLYLIAKCSNCLLRSKGSILMKKYGDESVCGYYLPITLNLGLAGPKWMENKD
jgi:hypothetical protein